MEDEEMPEASMPTPGSGSIRFGEATAGTAEQKAAGIAAGNIEVHDDEADTLDLPQQSSHAQQIQEAALQEMELRRRLRATIVPTGVPDVKRVLRTMGEPITLFGERDHERRERLQRMLADKSEEEQEAILAPAGPDAQIIEQAATQKEKFYTEGSYDLRRARMQLAYFSLQRASQRISAAKRKRDSPDEDEPAEQADAVAKVKALVNQASEIGDERPLSACAFSPEGTALASASFSGIVKVWDMPALQKTLTIKAHESRVTGVAWHPGARQLPSAGNAAETGPTNQPDAASPMDMEAGSSTVALGSASADCTACLWSREGKLLHRLVGHTQRLGRLAFHPAGAHVGTASYDGTWRLWDVETAVCLLEQEGHSRSVYTVAFQCDGSLAASAGLDAYGRIWDMRTGRSIMILEGHVAGVLSIDFSPNGYQLATGSEDNTARVWDLRKRSCIYTIPAHQSLVSSVRYDPEAGHYLVTSSFDRLSKVWSGKDFKLLKTLAGHEGHVMSSDLCPDGSHMLASASHDHTIKLWTPDQFAEA